MQAAMNIPNRHRLNVRLHGSNTCLLSYLPSIQKSPLPVHSVHSVHSVHNSHSSSHSYLPTNTVASARGATRHPSPPNSGFNSFLRSLKLKCHSTRAFSVVGSRVGRAYSPELS